MSVQDVARSNFTAGQISQKLGMRLDVGKRANGCAGLTNMIPLAYGGVTRRPATRYVAPTKGDGDAALIAFEFNTTQAYVMEFGDGYARVFADRGQLRAGAHGGVVQNGAFDASAGWTASAVTIAAGVATFAAGGVLKQAVTLSDPEARVVIAFKVDGSNALADRLSLAIGTTDGGSELQSAEEFGVGWHSWDVTPGVGVGTLHLTFSRVGGAPTLDDVVFLDDAPLEFGAPYTAAQAHKLRTTQSADILYLAQRDHHPYVVKRRGNYRWSLEFYAISSDPFDEDDRYPATVAFHEARLVYGGTAEKPDTLWFSVKNGFDDFTTGDEDDDALTVTLNAQKPHEIRWMASADDLRVGTSGAEWRVFGQDNQAITPDTIDARETTTRRSAQAAALKIDDVILFLERTGRKLRELLYVFESDGYKARDLNLLSDEIADAARMVQFDYQQEPYSIIWARCDDGSLLSLTYDRDQEVTAWARHRIGGVSDGVAFAQVESLAGIPAPNGRQDDVWFVVKRRINGQTRRYVEHLADFFAPSAPNDTAAMRFADAGASYEGASAIAITGLDYLEGETVQVLANGAVHPELSVAGGSVTLQAPANKVDVGLGSVAEIEDHFGPILRTPRGVARGLLQQVRRLRLDLLDSYEGVEVVYRGEGEVRAERLVFRDGDDPLDKAASLFTGMRLLDYPGAADRNLQIIIRQSDPVALHVRGWVAEMEAFD